MGYRDRYAEAENEGRYIRHVAGDVSSFRYPHLEKWSHLFAYDSGLQLFVYEGSDEELRQIAAEDITTYEFITPEARKLHVSDMLAFEVTEEDREAAFDSVLRCWANRKQLFSDTEIRTICPRDMYMRPEFRYIGEIYRDQMDIPVKVVTVKGGRFPFGSVLKGTNIIITDGNECNLAQDMVHMLFHLREGIAGPDNDNMYVEEIWANVPDLYALQLLKGRMARRIRKRTSPHPIHFTDYIYLRAFLGLAFTPEKTADRLHPVYGVIEPALRPVFRALEGERPEDLCRIIADAVLLDCAGELVKKFDDCFGSGAFMSIYDQYSLYDKYSLAGKFIKQDELDRMMFGGSRILDTEADEDYVESIWRARINEDNVVLSAGII